MTKFMESHMSSMVKLFQSWGLDEMCRKMPSGDTLCSSKFFETRVMGSRQQAQKPSRRTSLSLKGGMCEKAMDSLAQPTKLWNSSSM